MTIALWATTEISSTDCFIVVLVLTVISHDALESTVS